MSIDNGGDPEAFLRHLVDDIVHRRLDADHRHLIAAMHQVVHAQETLAQLSAGMEESEVLFLEAFSQQQGHSQRVAECQCGGGRRGRGEAEWTGFPRDRR